MAHQHHKAEAKSIPQPFEHGAENSSENPSVAEVPILELPPPEIGGQSRRYPIPDRPLPKVPSPTGSWSLIRLGKDSPKSKAFELTLRAEIKRRRLQPFRIGGVAVVAILAVNEKAVFQVTARGGRKRSVFVLKTLAAAAGFRLNDFGFVTLLTMDGHEPALRAERQPQEGKLGEVVKAQAAAQD